MATATLLDVSSLTPNVSISHTEANDGDLDEDVNSRSSSSIVTEIEGVDGDSMSFSSPLDNASAEDWADIHEASATLAHQVASLLYPGYADSSLPQIIKYEKDIVGLRKAIIAKLKAEEVKEAEKRDKTRWKWRVAKQGAWDEEGDRLERTGAPALPMPVVISDQESLRAFFEHLSGGGTNGALKSLKGQEPFYGVDIAEFEKGILYEDGRMDLCKMVLGPLNISQLMTSLENNTFVRHFLLGNNMIGPVGARLISDFVFAHPDRMETWYLAGNCIDLTGFKRLVSAWITSTSITNIWLKRNPLGPNASMALCDLITKTSNLRTLDLDQTELGDEGVAHLFSLLANHHSLIPLRHIYLNAVGIGQSACKSLTMYLSSPHCALESVYLSANPVGDAGANALAEGLGNNQSLLRLTLASCGLKSQGVKRILQDLQRHPRLMTLHMGQSYATEDLNMRYNYLEDEVVDSVKALLSNCKSLRMLELGTTGMTLSALESISTEVVRSTTLVVFSAKSVHGKVSTRVKLPVKERIENNIRQQYGGIDGARFMAEEKRWLISPKDVRLIGSAYRNRDSGLARRGQLVLKKVWVDDLETVNGVMVADDDA